MDMSQQFELNKGILDQRLAHGDRVDEARPVDHFATFRSKKGAEAAAADLIAKGFEVSVIKKMFSADLMAVHQSAVDRDSANAFTTEVATLITEHGGVYDGWGASIVE